MSWDDTKQGDCGQPICKVTASEWNAMVAYIKAMAGSTTWLGLTDTPAAFTGQKGLLPRVNTGETALEFKHNAIPTTFVVAANDAKDKLRSDYQCDASADQTEINNAITALP